MFKRKKRFISFLMAFIMIFGSFQIKNELAYAQTTSINASDSSIIDNNTTTENEFEDTDLEKTIVIDDLEEEQIPEDLNIDLEEEITILDTEEELVQDELLHSKSNLNADNIVINTADDLADISLNLSGNYILGKDIDLTGFNFEPIGTYLNPFTGSLDGQNYTIRNLIIDRNDEDNVGIFKYTKDSIFSNLNLENINVYGKNKVSAFVGEDNNSQFTNIKLNDIWVTGESEVGSILGYSYHGRIKNCSITGKGFITGTSSKAGGLIGNLAGGLLEESYSTNCITGESYVGGLVGYSYANTIKNCYSLSRVEALAESFAYPGGIAGRSERIENSYFAGIIFGDNREGISRGSETSCYYNDEINRIKFTYYPLQKKNSEELTKQETFLNWDFENTWEFKSGFNTPYLKNTEMDTDLNFEEGTFYNPYKIENATDLLRISEDLNAHYELANDIDLSGIDFEPIGTKEIPFRGALNGKDFTIKNLTIDKPDNYDVGLFGYIKDCKIENLFMKNITVSGSGSVGGLVGTSENSDLNNIHLEDVYITGFNEIGGLLGKATSFYITKIKNISVTGEGFVNGQYKSGGIIGYINNKSILEESYSEVLVSGYSEISGLVGYASEGNILNCYSLSKVVGPGIAASSLSKAGGLLGDGTTFVTIENSYFAGEITEIANRFGLVPDAINGKVTNSYFDNTINKIGQPAEQSKTTEELKLQSTFIDWDFENIWVMNGEYSELRMQSKPTDPEPPNEKPKGSGTESDPYIIVKVEDFTYINEELNAHYKLGSNIDLAGITFKPIGTEKNPFIGMFNGNNHTISNFKIESESDNIGFFGFTNSAEIRDLVIENITVSGKDCIGALVGQAKYSKISNVHIKESTITGNDCAGGLVGYTETTEIKKCSVTGEGLVTGNSSIGGVIGFMIDASKLNESFSNIDIKGNNKNIGGLVGTLGISGEIRNCYSSSSVHGSTDYTAGILGRGYGYGATIVENTLFTGVVSSNAGIWSYYNFGDVVVKNSYFDLDTVISTIPADQAKSFDELTQKETFIGWDFENIWVMNGEYPELKMYNYSTNSKILFNTQNFKNIGESDEYFLISDTLKEITGQYIGENELASLKVKISNGNLILDEFEIEAKDNWLIDNLKLMFGLNKITLIAKDTENKSLEESIILYNTNKDNATGLNLDENDDDGDGLINYKETIYGTDPLNPDTDGDGTNDYIEIFVTFTDPLVPDTDINDDIDGDKITNDDEMFKYGTNPKMADSDFDGIPDGEEIAIGTNPLNFDTDDDSFPDLLEIELGLDPLISNSESSVDVKIDTRNQKDTDLIKTSIESEVSKEVLINNYEMPSVYKLFEDSELTEDIPGFLDYGVEVGLVNNLADAKLNFEYDNSLNENNFLPTIYYVTNEPEKLEKLEELENQIVTGNKVSAIINKTGKYILLNKTKYEAVKKEALGLESIQSFSTMDSTTSKRKNIIIAIDKDYDMRFTHAKAVAILITNYLNEEHYVSVVTLHLSGFTVLTDFTNDKEKIKNAIMSFQYYNTDTSINGNRAFSSLYSMLEGAHKLDIDPRYGTEIVLLTGKEEADPSSDAKANFKTTNLNFTDLIKASNARNIPISVFESKNQDNDPNEALSELTKKTNSYMHKVISGNFGFPETDKRTKVIVDYLNTNILIKPGVDTDGDGLTDHHEELLKSGNAYDTFCRKINLLYPDKLSIYDPDIKDSDRAFNADYSDDSRAVDGLADGEEIIHVKGKVFRVYSDPTTSDTDSDGYNDHFDIRPMVHSSSKDGYGERILRTNSFERPYTSKHTLEMQKERDLDFDSKSFNFDNLEKDDQDYIYSVYTWYVVVADMLNIPLGDVIDGISSAGLQTDKGLVDFAIENHGKKNPVHNFSLLPDGIGAFVDFMHLPIRADRDSYVRQIRVTEYLKNSTDGSFLRNLNLKKFINYAEQHMPEDGTIYVKTRYNYNKEDNFTLSSEEELVMPKNYDTVFGKLEPHINENVASNLTGGYNKTLQYEGYDDIKVNLIDVLVSGFTGFNWVSTFGSAPASLSAEIRRNGNDYKMTLNYQIDDFLQAQVPDTPDGKIVANKIAGYIPIFDSGPDMLHEYGLAKEHRAQGIAKMEITWKNGAEIPKSSTKGHNFKIEYLGNIK